LSPQESLKQKTRQMKAMAGELNMYQAQVLSRNVLLCPALDCPKLC